MNNFAQSHAEPSLHAETHSLSVRTCLVVWAGLMLLTGITVGVSFVDFGFLHVFVALVVATVKAALVILWFMHIRYEGAALRTMVFVAFFMLAVCIGFTFFDVAYR